MMSNAFKLNFIPQLPEITVKGLLILLSGLLRILRNGESGFIASRPGN